MSDKIYNPNNIPVLFSDSHEIHTSGSSIIIKFQQLNPGVIKNLPYTNTVSKIAMDLEHAKDFQKVLAKGIERIEKLQKK